MNKLNHWLEKIFKFFASIWLAIFILSSLAIMSAVGTIYEARYDAAYAQKMIYHSPFMYFIMALLVVNLFNVMVDRWPWRAHHTGFVLAHVGIILLVLGALVTRLYGVDGSVAIDISQKNNYVVLPDSEFNIYASFGDGNYKALYSTNRDFLISPPSKDPLVVPLGPQNLVVKDYYPFASRSEMVTESKNPQDGPAIRVQLQNPNVNLVQWLYRPLNKPFEIFNMGPARIVWADANTPYKYEGENEVVLRQRDADTVSYEIYTKSKGGKTKSGIMSLAEPVETGWMGLTMRMLKLLPRADKKIEYKKLDRPSGTSTSAVVVEYAGQEHTIGLNSNLRLFSDSMMYLASYRNRLLDLGFDIHLNKFTVGRYQGTQRAMSYESEVSVPGIDNQVISMNNPLKYRGYTFYQASFQEDEMGRATTSVLSVNKDPGRPIKYFGSFILVLGTIIMFYFKRYRLKIMNFTMGSGDSKK